MDEPSNPVRLNEKWIAVIVWAVLLALLYLTSTNGALLGFGGNVQAFFTTFVNLGMPFDQAPEQRGLMVTMGVVSLLMTIGLTYLLASAWMRFVDLTNTLLVAFVKRTEPGASNPIFFEMLHFKEPEKLPEDEAEEIATDPDDANGSMVGSILRSIALSWGIIILSPGVIVVVGLMFS